MRVLVTGGTGFVGCHIVAALVQAGHSVRLLVRDRDKARSSLAPFGADVVAAAQQDVVVGDVLDPQVVRGAVNGCDAVVHAAAIYSLDPRRADEIERTNVEAAENVLGEAVRARLSPVVHISTYAVLVRKGGTDPSLPLGDIDYPYTRSKILSEQVARGFQAAGDPVVTVYPGSTLGPHDPYRGDQSERLRWLAAGRLPIWPSGRTHYTDVRDVAALVAAVVNKCSEPHRYVVPGHFADGKMIFGALERATGRKYPFVTVPAGLMLALLKPMDVLQRRLPAQWTMPAYAESVDILRRGTEFDTSAATTELGVSARPFDDTVRDTVRWLVESGRLSAKYGVAQPLRPAAGGPA